MIRDGASILAAIADSARTYADQSGRIVMAKEVWNAKASVAQIRRDLLPEPLGSTTEEFRRGGPDGARDSKANRHGYKNPSSCLASVSSLATC